MKQGLMCVVLLFVSFRSGQGQPPTRVTSDLGHRPAYFDKYPSTFKPPPLPPSAVQTADTLSLLTALKLDKTHQHWGDNFVISPFSITSALAQLLLGAGGRTREELVQFLDLTAGPDGEEAIHEQLKKITALVAAKHNNTELTIASAMFYQKTFSINSQFQYRVKNNYKCQITSVDFQRNPETAKEVINQWVSANTGGKIQQLLSSPPSQNLVLLLANAIYFNGAWETQFNPQLTAEGDFKVRDQETSRVMFMRGQFEVPFAQSSTLGFKIIALPYKHRVVAMYIILPNIPGKTGLSRLVQTLNPDYLVDVINSMQVKTVALSIPKMSIESSLRLRQPLSELGVTTLFDSRNSNLTGISSSRQIHVDDIFHKVVLQVSETGTEAAATTSLSVHYSSPEAVFRADRPFLFFIRHELTGATLFWGSVVKPDFNDYGTRLYESHDGHYHDLSFP